MDKKDESYVEIGPQGIRVHHAEDEVLPCDEPDFKTIGDRFVEEFGNG